MDVTGDIDTLQASLHHRKTMGFMGLFAGFGGMMVGIGAAFLVAWFSPASEPAFGFLGPMFMLVGGVPAVLGGVGLSGALRRVEVRMELHELHVACFYAGLRTQQFSVPLSDLTRVERVDDELRLSGTAIAHTIDVTGFTDEEVQQLADLLAEAVQQRDEQTRRAPAELLALVRARSAAR